MLKEFAAKKCGKLGKLLKESGGLGLEVKRRDSDATNSNSNPFSGSERITNSVEVNDIFLVTCVGSILNF